MLPFGLSTVPFLLTTLFKPLIKNWRSEAYLGAGATFHLPKIASLQVHSDLLKVGLLPNEDKCTWNPSHIITWLGSLFNMINSSISATGKRIESLETDIEYLM